MLPVILTSLLSSLASNGLTSLASAVEAKGKEFIEDKLGVSLEESVKSEEGLLKLKQLELDHEEELIRLAQAGAERELKAQALDVDDTKNARETNRDILVSANVGGFIKAAPTILDFFVFTVTAIILFVLIRWGVDTSVRDQVFMAVGSLLTMCGTIMHYHRGTTSRSGIKDDTIQALSKGTK